MTATRTFLAGIERGHEGFGIVFPDFPGCVSAGETIQDALVMGKEALTLHIEGMLEDGLVIPIPSDVTLERLAVESPESDWVAIGAVEVAVPQAPDTVAVPIKAELVREIADLVRRNVSTMGSREFIENAARRELDRLKKSA